MTPSIDVVVVGPPDEVWTVACACAAERALTAAAHAALVIAAGAAAGAGLPGLPAGRAARRIRDHLSTHAVEARAAGRVVWCRSAGSQVCSLATAARATGAAVVLAVYGPREPWCEPLLQAAGGVLVAGRQDDPLTALAVAGLRARGIDSHAATRPGDGAALLARVGLARPPRPGAHAA